MIFALRIFAFLYAKHIVPMMDKFFKFYTVILPTLMHMTICNENLAMTIYLHLQWEFNSALLRILALVVSLGVNVWSIRLISDHIKSIASSVAALKVVSEVPPNFNLLNVSLRRSFVGCTLSRTYSLI